MRPFAFVALAIGSGLASTALQTPQQAAQQGVVFVEVTVLDATGSAISALTRDDFELLVDGRARPIEYVAPDDSPVLVVLLLDVSASCWIQPGDLKPAIEKHFWDGLGPSDRLRLGLVGAGPVVLSPSFGGERVALRSMLHLLDLQPTYTVRDKLVPTTSSVVPQMGVRERKATGARMGPSPIWDAVYDAASALEHEPGRRVVILLTDGRATGNVHGLDETIVHALAAGVPIHVVSEAEDVIIPIDASNAARVRPDVFLKGMADQTGGSYASVLDALAASGAKGIPSGEKISEQVGVLLSRALQQAHRTYALGFTAPTLDNRLHRLEVRVRRLGLTVRAPADFVARRAAPFR